MIAVSNDWVTAHSQTLLPEMFVEITYSATEPGVQQSATSTGSNEISFSNAAQITSSQDKFPEKYATLEHGIWGLDGTFDYYDGSPDDPGYVGLNLANDDAQFETVPVITIRLSEIRFQPLPGITITWSEVFDEWASDFRVTAWADSVRVAQTEVVGNTSPVSRVMLEMVNYNRITIEVLKWSHPHHRARCIDVFLGVRNIYTKKDLLGFTHSQSADLLSAALPKNEITFRLRNEDDRWNPDNPTGVEQYLLARQEIKLRYGMDVNGSIEWIKGGTFWLSEWSTPSNGLEASFTARDALEYMGEPYTGIASGTLYDIAEAAFVQAELPPLDDGTPRYVIHESLRNYTTSFSGEYTMAQVLQVVAHAGNCVLHQDRDGVMRMEPWNIGYSGYVVDQYVSYSHPEYNITKPLKSVSVKYGDEQHHITTVANRGEIQTVENELIRTETDARRVGARAAEVLANRKVISGEFRADVRLDALDPIVVSSKYASNIIAVTEIDYSTTGGAFRGRYTGRVVSINLKSTAYHANEVYAGEV